MGNGAMKFGTNVLEVLLYSRKHLFLKNNSSTGCKTSSFSMTKKRESVFFSLKQSNKFTEKGYVKLTII